MIIPVYLILVMTMTPTSSGSFYQLLSQLKHLLSLSLSLSPPCTAYFLVDEPHLDTQWLNDQANLVQWRKGLLDGVNGFDVELARLNTDGLLLVAMNVPSEQNSINIFLKDVPAGDDYFLAFMNATHGTLLATSSRFAVLAAGGSATPTSQVGSSPNTAVPTITVSGAPDATKLFATTFPALPDSGAFGGRHGVVPGWAEMAVMVLVVSVSMAAGTVWMSL